MSVSLYYPVNLFFVHVIIIISKDTSLAVFESFAPTDFYEIWVCTKITQFSI